MQQCTKRFKKDNAEQAMDKKSIIEPDGANKRGEKAKIKTVGMDKKQNECRGID